LTSKRGRMPTILVLDDDADNRGFVGIVVERYGCKVYTAADGEEALSFLRREPVDLLIQDVKRPGMNGLKLYHVLKSDADLRDIPVLFLTGAMKLPERAERTRRKYGDGYMVKPYSMDALILTLNDLLLARGKPVPTREEQARAHAAQAALWKGRYPDWEKHHRVADMMK
jgi:two-component system, NtrC family, response regulator AtoC